MRKLTMTAWLLAACGWMIGSASAAEPGAVLTADAVFNSQDSHFVQPVGFRDSCSLGCGDGLGDGFSLYGLYSDDCDPCPVEVGGWMSAGYHNRPTGLFNSHPHQLNANQMWMYAEKVADGSDGIDFGFRVDALYGVDAQDTQAFGNPNATYDLSSGFQHGIYGWAIPQLYGEVAMGDFSVIAGHFYTLLGYEVVQAPDNFFYSHAFTQYLSEAFTHTGVLGTYSASDNVTLYGGWTAGWDTGFDQFGGGSNFLGGASVSVLDNVAVTYILTAGDLGFIGEGYTHSVVADVQITDSLNYVLQSDYVHTNGAVLNAGDNGYDTIGINQYLIYWANDHLGVGGRAEWWKANGVSYYEATAGVNIKPCANFVIRPEVRYQWSPTVERGGANPAGLPTDDGAIFGVDAILTF